eukprot:scaffold9735_cov54-Phaeocystis_antarctica.AAC.2
MAFTATVAVFSCCGLFSGFCAEPPNGTVGDVTDEACNQSRRAREHKRFSHGSSDPRPVFTSCEDLRGKRSALPGVQVLVRPHVEAWTACCSSLGPAPCEKWVLAVDGGAVVASSSAADGAGITDDLSLSLARNSIHSFGFRFSPSLKLGEAVRQPGRPRCCHRERGLASGPAAALAGAPRMCEPCTADALLAAVRGLRVAEPDLGFKPLLAKLQEQQPDLGAATKEVREALKVLNAENEAAKAATAPPAAHEGVAPSHAALSLACIGCFRLPSDMDDEREKHPICDMCRDEKLPTTYLCGVDCPANPGAWQLHGAFHKKVRKHRKFAEDGGARQQRDREVAGQAARHAARTGDTYSKLLAEGARYGSKEDWRRAAKAFREAIALKPDGPTAYINLGSTLRSSGHDVEAAQRFLEAKECSPVGSENWAVATADAFHMLQQNECAEVAKPEWWNDEGLKAMSAR